MENKTVVIAFGGVSPEHEVSVLTAMQAVSALDSSPYRLVPLYISKSGKWYTGDFLLKLEHYENLDRVVEHGIPCSFAHSEYGKTVLKELKRGLFSRPSSHPVDTVLVAFHGSDGENGAFQGLCEMFDVPYTGCNVLSSALGMDKVTAKTLCRSHGVPVVEDYHFDETEWEKESKSILDTVEKLGYPVVAKPVHLGSSIGVSRADGREELTGAIELAFRYDEQLLVEKAVSPLMEINCSVLGEGGNCKVSVCERPLGSEQLLSFIDKYQSEEGQSKGMASASREIPARISPELTGRIQKTSQKIFHIIKGSGIARLDFLVNSDTQDYYFNEINSIPGSFSFYLWEESGTGFREILHELIELAIVRHARKKGRIQTYDTNLLNQKAARGLKGIKNKSGS